MRYVRFYSRRKDGTIVRTFNFIQSRDRLSIWKKQSFFYTYYKEMNQDCLSFPRYPTIQCFASLHVVQTRNQCSTSPLAISDYALKNSRNTSSDLMYFSRCNLSLGPRHASPSTGEGSSSICRFLRRAPVLDKILAMQRKA